MVEETRVAEVAKALASPVRVRILRILEAGEHCGCELVPMPDLDPPVVSRHLAVLSRAGLIESRRDGGAEVGDHLGLHYSTVSRIVSRQKSKVRT